VKEKKETRELKMLFFKHLSKLEAPGVHFANILGAAFSNGSASQSFSLVTFWLWQKYIRTFIQKNEHVKC
jgi:hypothetical protein